MATTPDTLIIHGGKPLKGTIALHGAKNALSKEMVAALLTAEPCVLQNVAEVRDVELVTEMIQAMGGTAELAGTTLTISADAIRPLTAEELDQYAGKSRIPILMCGPILNRFGKVVIANLGGCNIGARPVDFHIAALQQMGAEVQEDDAYLTLTAKKLKGAKIRLDYPSVGATEQVLLSAVLAEGVTHLSNAAVEPEIIDLICVLQKMGAIVSVDTDRVITITGVEKLHGYQHFCLTDRIEAASWACAALLTNGRITVEGARQIDMLTFLNAFRQVGGAFLADDKGITFWRQAQTLKPVAIETGVHPGFMTDWQQPFVIALTQAKGVSVVHETVYEERFGYTEALNDMGAEIQLFTQCLGGSDCRYISRNYKHSAVIVGPTPLHGAELTIPDLRGGFSYVLAALLAEGTSQLHNTSLIQRGYEHFLDKLTAVGADFSTPSAENPKI
jgi:UDP-N-acetylglucosamine 1-carboxyvinyltransferase